MWRILTIISAIALAASAVIGYLNMGKLDAEKASLQGNEKALATTTTRLNDTKEELKNKTEQRDAKVEQKKQQDAEKATLVAKNEGLTSELATLKAKLDEEGKKLADLKEKMKDAPNLDELEDKIKAHKQQDLELAQQVADAQAKLAAAEARIKSVELQVKDAEQRENDIRNHMSPASLNASIVSVHNALGLVIVNAGVNQEVVGASRLAVMRGSDKVAELLVSAVEKTRSAADIVPGSLKEGVSLMPGDKVIAIRELPKKEETKPAAKVTEPVKTADADTQEEDVFGSDSDTPADDTDGGEGADTPAEDTDSTPTEETSEAEESVE